MIERLEIVGADSISSLEQPTYMESNQRVDMKSAPTYKFNRKSLRLPHYDYSRAGYYFITITTQNREHLFGEIVGAKMVLNMAGEMVHGLWYDIVNDFPHVALHDFVIMPNHMHGIIQIKHHDNVGADSISALQQPTYHKSKMVVMKPKMVVMHSQKAETPFKQRADMKSTPTLSKIIQSYKRHTTLQYIKMVKNGTLPPFNKRIWQRNYYEHVVRDENDYVRIAEYVENNPFTWDEDILNEP